MRDEMTILGNLVKALDDARLFCVDGSVHTTRPWLKRVLEQLAQTHQLIADELCAYITTAGGVGIARDDRRRQAWRTTWSGWVARNHFDSDLAYIQQAKKKQIGSPGGLAARCDVRPMATPIGAWSAICTRSTTHA